MPETPRILVLGDSYMPAETFLAALRDRGLAADSATVTAVTEPTWSADGLREYEGDPAEVAKLIEGHDVLVLHGAPVTRAVLAANPSVRLIGCARGGPTNVDIDAARELGVTVTTTPGKNADAVADLTIGFAIVTLRNVLPSVRSVDEAAAGGGQISESAFEGARWFGGELRGRTLGLVGFGNVARLVAARAVALGMTVAAYDPFATPHMEGVRACSSLPELLEISEVLSLHARATDENRHLIDAAAIERLPAGAVLINTARESLLDEYALLDALERGYLAGAALDVCESDGPWRQLIEQPTVVLTPHIGGATWQTLRRGAQMLADEVVTWQQGGTLRWSR